MSADKRKRSANFSEDEKMRFLRILQQKGHVIISKVTSHDIQTNRLKEEAWTEVTNDLNASGTVLRTTENLKKLWQKMKTEAKTFKSNAYNQLRGTGGGPSKKIDDPVLELVAEITGRGSSGIESVNDSDFGISYTNTDLDLHTSTPAVCHKIIDSQSAIDLPDAVASYFEVGIDVENTCKSREKDNEVEMDMVKNKPLKTKDDNLKRRRPALDHNVNERSEIQDKRIRLNNTFTYQRLKCEKEKIGLIELQKQHMVELHASKIKQIEIKTQIMEAVLRKIKDEKPVDSEIVKAIFTDTS